MVTKTMEDVANEIRDELGLDLRREATRFCIYWLDDHPTMTGALMAAAIAELTTLLQNAHAAGRERTRRR